MTWEQCRNYGLVEIDSRNNTIKLYYSNWGFQFAGNPMFLITENATWQGNNLIVRGYDQYGTGKAIVMTNFNSYREII